LGRGGGVQGHRELRHKCPVGGLETNGLKVKAAIGNVASRGNVHYFQELKKTPPRWKKEPIDSKVDQKFSLVGPKISHAETLQWEHSSEPEAAPAKNSLSMQGGLGDSKSWGMEGDPFDQERAK